MTTLSQYSTSVNTKQISCQISCSHKELNFEKTPTIFLLMPEFVLASDIICFIDQPFLHTTDF
jgi:hypothetical protein